MWGGFGKASVCGELPGTSLFHVGAASSPQSRATRSPCAPASPGEERDGSPRAAEAKEKVMLGGQRDILGAALWGRVPGGTWEWVFAPTGRCARGVGHRKHRACVKLGT